MARKSGDTQSDYNIKVYMISRLLLSNKKMSNKDIQMYMSRMGHDICISSISKYKDEAKNRIQQYDVDNKDIRDDTLKNLSSIYTDAYTQYEKSVERYDNNDNPAYANASIGFQKIMLQCIDKIAEITGMDAEVTMPMEIIFSHIDNDSNE